MENPILATNLSPNTVNKIKTHVSILLEDIKKIEDNVIQEKKNLKRRAEYSLGRESKMMKFEEIGA